MDVGIDPVNLLLWRWRVCNLERDPIEETILPDSELYSRYNCVVPVMYPIDVGMRPPILLLDTAKTRVTNIDPTVDGMLPVKQLY